MRAADDQQAEPRRPGRWERPLRAVVVPFLAAEGAGFMAAAVVWATPLGALVLGWFSLLTVCASLEMWRRPQSRVGNVLLVLTCLAAVAVFWVCVLDSALWRAITVLVVGLTGYLAWLWWKYRRRLPVRRRPLSTWVGASGFCLGVVLGVTPVALLAIDEHLQPLGDLAVSRPDVPAGENALPAFESLMREHPIPDSHVLYELRCTGPGGDETMPDDWPVRARRVVAWFDEAGPALEEMLSRPRFIAPAAPAGSTHEEMQALQWESEWRTGLRTLRDMMLLRANVLILEGRPSESLRASEQLVDLGVLVCADAESLVTLGLGEGCVSTGLEALRDAGGAATDVAELRLLAGRLHMSGQLKAGLRGGLAGELALDRSSLDAFARLDLGFSHGDPDAILMRIFLRRLPLIKVDATTNMLAIEVRDALSRLDGYRPFDDEPAIEGMDGLVRRYGRGAVVGNPVGLVAAVMTPPTYRRSLHVCYRTIAEAQLTRVFLALRCHQLTTGYLPASLADLAPTYFDEVPADPFTEEPFGYDPEAATPVLYSVGPDQVRDGDGDGTDDVAVELKFAELEAHE